MASSSDQVDLLATQSLLNDVNISYLKELAVSENSQIDLIAVHGLRIPVNFAPWKDPQSFGVQTWAAGSPGHEKLWLKDFLPHDVPCVRVLLFGYNSNVGWDASTAGVSGAADDLLLKLKNKRLQSPDRPIIFLCHSLGGIVVKHAIAKARSNPKYEPIFNSVRGISFFATPHRGGLAAKHGAAVAGAIRHATRSPRSSIMEALRADSLISFDIHQYFLHSLARVRICSFYEMKPLPGVGRLVVDKNSALLGLPYPQEDAMPVPESNHSTICKFENRSQNYELVVSGIADLITWALQKIPAPDTLSISRTNSSADSFDDEEEVSDLTASYRDVQLSHAYLPDFGDVDLSKSEKARPQTSYTEPLYLWPSLTFEHLTGRERLMNSIQEALLLRRSHQTRLAIYGLGGVGKTQIALHLIQWYRSRFSNESIFWIHGGGADMLRQSLTEIALRRKLLEREDIATDSLEVVRQYLLNENNGRWLMVVDNADNPDTFFKTINLAGHHDKSNKVALGMYIPRCVHGRVVFTTNSKVLGEKLSMQGSLIEIPHLDLPGACELLQKRLFDDVDSEEGPPSYQREMPAKTALEKLCEYLDCLPLALIQAAAFMRQQNVTVGEYIKLLDEDESRISDLLAQDFQTPGHDDEFTKAVGSTWNVTFDRILADVPIAADLLSFMAFLDSKNIPKFLLRHVVNNEWDLTVIGLGTLQSYALVNPASKEETLSIHRLVQHAIQKRLAAANTASKWSRKALSVLAEHFPDGGHESWDTCASLVPHASQVLRKDYSNDMEDILLVATLQFKLSQYYCELGLYSHSADLSLETLETLARLPDAPKALKYKSKSVRAQALKDCGQLQEAEDIAKEVWYERQHDLGAKHHDTLESYNLLAMMYQEQGKYKEAVKAARYILKSLRKTAKEDDLTVQSAKRRLGTILHKLGEISEAEALLREVLDGYTRKSGPDDKITLKVKWRLAWVLHDHGKFEEAEQTSFETWTAQKRIFGEDHPDSLKSLYLYADNLQAQSKFGTAVTFKRHVHARSVALVGPKHRYSLISAASLASCLVASVLDEKSCAAYEEASELFKEVLKGREETLIPDHPETLAARNDVAVILRLEGSLSEAEVLERETLKKAKLVLEKQHPLVLETREGLARTLWAQKESKEKSKEAVEQINKVLKVKEKRYGWGYSGTRDTAAFLVEMLADGREKKQLQKKIAKSAATAGEDGSTSRESLNIVQEPATEGKGDAAVFSASSQSLDKNSEKEGLDDAWFKQ